MLKNQPKSSNLIFLNFSTCKISCQPHVGSEKHHSMCTAATTIKKQINCEKQILIWKVTFLFFFFFFYRSSLLYKERLLCKFGAMPSHHCQEPGHKSCTSKMATKCTSTLCIKNESNNQPFLRKNIRISQELNILTEEKEKRKLDKN